MFFELSLVALIALVGSVSCSLQGRIINGINSNIEKYKFMVSLRDKTGYHFCGGTILNTMCILTAAHCVYDESPSDISIQYGTTVISADNKNVINAKEFIIHKKYDSKTNNNDIALVKLEKPIVSNSQTGPVKLPDLLFEVPQDKYGAPGVALGWGAKSLQDLRKMESNLQEVQLKIYSDKDCKSMKKRFTFEKLCAGVDKGGICNGDSGSPLLSKDFVQLGIASTIKKPCGGAYGSFIKVSYYRDWIDKHSK